MGTSEPKMQKTKESPKSREKQILVRDGPLVKSELNSHQNCGAREQWSDILSKDVGMATGSQKMLNISNLSWDICTLGEISLP